MKTKIERKKEKEEEEKQATANKCRTSFAANVIYQHYVGLHIVTGACDGIKQ